MAERGGPGIRVHGAPLRYVLYRVYEDLFVLDTIDAVCSGGDAYFSWWSVGVRARSVALCSVQRQVWDTDQSRTPIHVCLALFIVMHDVEDARRMGCPRVPSK